MTLTGPGGIGKTRLAVAVGERLQDQFEAGTAFVPLAAVTDPQGVLAGIGRAVAADLAGAGSPLQALAEQLGDDAWLLILDNLEQVVEVAGELGELLARCPGVSILATSRTVLGLWAEQEYPVLPLQLPADPVGVPVDELAAAAGGRCLWTGPVRCGPAPPYRGKRRGGGGDLAERLEGLPLAAATAAARTRLLDPAALLRRLSTSLDALGTGNVGMPERQHTLRATVEWSVDLLDDAERSLLEVVAVFADGWTIEAAASVAGLGEDRTLELSETLARHSLIYLDPAADGPRSRMLETIRQFVAERLAGRPDAAEVRHRHAEYYRALAEQADRPLRGTGHREWARRLDAEAGNLAAAVRWYLDHDRAPLPHLFRVLLPLWALQDDLLAEARPWVEQILPAADSLDPEARIGVLWAAAVTAREVGDDAAALAARRPARRSHSTAFARTRSSSGPPSGQATSTSLDLTTSA